MIRRGLISFRVFIVLCILAAAGIMGVQVDTVQARTEANIHVDASIIESNYNRPEQYNNLNPRGAVDTQIADFQSYDTKMVRFFGLMADWFRDDTDLDTLDMDWYDQWFNRLDQAELYAAESILMPIKHYPRAVGGENWDPSAFEEVLKQGLVYMKSKYSKLEWITAWNEPNHPDGPLPNSDTANIQNYMVVYEIFENVINYVNEHVDNGEPLKLGGPITANFYFGDWIEKFVLDVKANNRKMDFVSWNYYNSNVLQVGTHVDQVRALLDDNGFYDAEIIISEYGLVGGGADFNPSFQSTAKQMAMMASAGYEYMNAGAIPVHWINEHSSNYIKSQYGYNFKISSGTSSTLETYDFDEQTARYVKIQGHGNSVDNFTSIKEVQIFDSNGVLVPIVSAYAAGDFNNIGNLYDDNLSTRWEAATTWRRQITFDLGSDRTIGQIKIAWNHDNTIEKVYKFAVQASLDDVTYTNVWDTSKILPYGHLLKMQSMMASTRVRATSDARENGVMAYAAKDDDKVTVLVWNYQQSGVKDYNVILDVANLPPAFAGKDIRYEQYIAGERNSNYQYAGFTTLNKPVDTIISTSSAGNMKFTLMPNTVSSIVLTPIDPISDSLPSDSYEPVDDAYVQSNNAHDGIGSSISVKHAVTTTANRKGFVKFDLSSSDYSSTDIVSAKMKLYNHTLDGLFDITAFEITDDTWTESSIRWNNAPELGNAITSTGITSTNQYYEWDITDYVKSQIDLEDYNISVALFDPNMTSVYAVFNTKEAADNRPMLEIVTSTLPPLPEAPIHLIASPGNAQVNLTWNASTQADSYNIERSITPMGPYSVIDSVYGTIYTDSDVTNGITYYYTVTAVNESGQSDPSNEVIATPRDYAGRALIVITLENGIEKEYDWSMIEVNAFIDWYDNKSSGAGSARYLVEKEYNKGPFTSRKEFLVHDKIITFEFMEYEE